MKHNQNYSTRTFCLLCLYCMFCVPSCYPRHPFSQHVYLLGRPAPAPEACNKTHANETDEPIFMTARSPPTPHLRLYSPQLLAQISGEANPNGNNDNINKSILLILRCVCVQKTVLLVFDEDVIRASLAEWASFLRTRARLLLVQPPLALTAII